MIIILHINYLFYSIPGSLEQRVYDFGKENKQRLREIQRRCKEQEAERAQSRPVPVKALWTSSKFQNVPSKVMVQLEVRVTSGTDLSP